MSERLKEIKKRFTAMNELESFKKLAPTDLFFDDIEWLIQQAERIETLNEQLETALKAKDQAISYNTTLENQIQELEQGIENLNELTDMQHEQNTRLERINRHYKHALEFGVKYLQNSNIRQIQLVVSALKKALEDKE